MGDEQLRLAQPQVLAVEAEPQFSADREQRRLRVPSRAGRAQRVDDGVVGGDLQRPGVGLGGLEGAPDPDVRVGQPDAGGVEADQPSGDRVPSVGGGPVHALVELFLLAGVQQHPHGAGLAAGDHGGVQGGPYDVVPGGEQGGHHLVVGEVSGAPGRRERDALGPGAEAGGGAVRVQQSDVPGAGHRALGARGTTVIRNGSAGRAATGVR